MHLWNKVGCHLSLMEHFVFWVCFSASNLVSLARLLNNIVSNIFSNIAGCRCVLLWSLDAFYLKIDAAASIQKAHTDFSRVPGQGLR
jgi:hypothetical protein